MRRHFSRPKNSSNSKGARGLRSPFLFFAVCIPIAAAAAAGNVASESLSARIEKARETVLKGERLTAIKIFKELARETASAPTSKGAREVIQGWREVAEVYLTDKGQNQASLAESFWMTRPKDASDMLLPLLRTEDSNLQVARLGARAALRSTDCAKAETFVTQAELVFPNGTDVRLLRLQAQDCLNGTNMAATPLKIPLSMTGHGPEHAEWSELEPALRLLAVKDAFRRKDVRAAKTALGSWETQASLGAVEDPEFWYWKWRISPEASRDRSAAREYLRLCTKLTPRRRKAIAMHPELCVHTETIESELKSSEKSGL